jgi:vancomycin permeability regulator SanA
MDDKDILGNIDVFIAEEHELRAKAVGAPGLSEAEHARLRELEVRLDQCWDLLRQRRAKAEFGRDPNTAATRPADEVEHYRS